VLNIFLMFEIFLVSSWDISHSQFGIQNQILTSRGYRDTANFRPWSLWGRDNTPNRHTFGKLLSRSQEIVFVFGRNGTG
jgi:hypothetical protein